MLEPRAHSQRLLRSTRLLPAIAAIVAFAFGFAFRADARTPQDSQLLRELDLPSYEAELDRIASEVKQTQAIHELRSSLPRLWIVRTSERRIDVSTTWLVQNLEEIEKNPAKSSATVKEVMIHLAAMRQAAKEMEAPATGSSLDAAHDRLNKILAQSEFDGEHGPSEWERTWNKIGQWVGEQILKLMRALHLGAATGNIISWSVVGLAFLALAYFAYRTMAGRQKFAEIENAAPADLSDSRQWARDALAAAERRDYREAVHCAYWASIVRLESLGLLKRDWARTPRESLRLLEPHATEHRSLREFTRHFELIWYGYRPASAEDWSAARAHLEKLGCLTASTPATANS
jgi:Domain of unknown function (DUF4129)